MSQDKAQCIAIAANRECPVRSCKNLTAVLAAVNPSFRPASAFANALTGQLDAMRVVHEAVEDGIGVGGIVDLGRYKNKITPC